MMKNQKRSSRGGALEWVRQAGLDSNVDLTLDLRSRQRGRNPGFSLADREGQDGPLTWEIALSTMESSHNSSSPT
jgi:hypothetical protein